MGKEEAVVRYLRLLRDVEILQLYFLLIWSEWNFLYTTGLDEIQLSIREHFGGIGSRSHRKDLIERLDHVLGKLEWENIVRHMPGINQYQLHRARMDYRTLKEVLLEVEREAVSLFICASPFRPVC